MRFAVCLLPLALLWSPPPVAAQDREQARFGMCTNAPRVTCVVDGDTFWYRGTKIRIADINTPETYQASCAAERALGKRATIRLTQLLNAGAFTLVSEGRDEDRYRRKLRVVAREGRSLGAVLVSEGLAERWTGNRRDWCASLPSAGTASS